MHSLVEHDDLVGERHRLDLVVRHIDHRRAELGMELGEFEAHLHAQLGVEVGQRLVEQEHLGLAHQRATDRDALALAARKLGRTAIETGLELQHARDFGARSSCTFLDWPAIESEKAMFCRTVMCG